MYHLSSPPVPVYFLGFESTTARLQQAGWDLSFERDSYRQGVRIGMRHKEARLYSMSGFSPDFPRSVDPFIIHGEDYARARGVDARNILPPFRIDHVNADIKILSEHNPFKSFKSFDAIPAVITREEWYMSGADIFRSFHDLRETQKIYLDDADDGELLRKLVEKQQPLQAEIRERARMAEARGVPALEKVEAKIIRLANWR